MQRGKITKGFRPLTIKLSVVYNVRLKTKPRMIFKRGIHTFRNLKPVGYYPCTAELCSHCNVNNIRHHEDSNRTLSKHSCLKQIISYHLVWLLVTVMREGLVKREKVFKHIQGCYSTYPGGDQKRVFTSNILQDKISYKIKWVFIPNILQDLIGGLA